MTTPRDLRDEIERLLSMLMEADIVLLRNHVVLSKVSGAQRITWATSGTESSELFREHFSSVENYCQLVAASAYSAILFDGSLLQFSYEFRRNDLCGHRLLFYPCPFDVDSALLREEPIIDVLSLYRDKGDVHLRLRSPLRFDFAPEIHSADHPATHLTILWNHCRCPVVAPLSPGHFVRFVFRNFYPQLWRVHEFIREWPRSASHRTITVEEEKLLHIAWRE